MSKFNILSFDGGGIKGVLSIRLIQRIRDQFPELLEVVDMYVGTSTGGIIALALAAGVPIDTIKNLYIEKGKDIFHRNWWRVFGITGPKYSNHGLRREIDRLFADEQLGDLKSKVLISSFDLKSSQKPYRWKPKFFHNFGDDRDDPVRIADVAMYTSAAPTYFPAVDGYVDGGMVANNPSMAAICQVLDDRYGDQVLLEDISLLSVGTGVNYQYIDGDRYNFGAKDITKIVGILLDGTKSVPEYQCSVILDKKYFRLDPIDEQNTKLDDVKAIGHLLEIADRWPLDDIIAWLENFWK